MSDETTAAVIADSIEHVLAERLAEVALVSGGRIHRAVDTEHRVELEYGEPGLNVRIIVQDSGKGQPVKSGDSSKKKRRDGERRLAQERRLRKRRRERKVSWAKK